MLQRSCIDGAISTEGRIEEEEVGVGGGGSNIRLVTFTLGATAVTVLLEQGRFYFDRTLSLLFGGWCIAAALTAINSYDLTASLGYTAWIAFDFLLVIGVSYNVALRIDSESLMDMWILVFRIHVVLLGIELVVRHVLGLSSGASRPHLWFYEPSYVAIFLGGYLTSALYLSGCGERRWGDVALGAATHPMQVGGNAGVALFLHGAEYLA